MSITGSNLDCSTILPPVTKKTDCEPQLRSIPDFMGRQIERTQLDYLTVDGRETITNNRVRTASHNTTLEHSMLSNYLPDGGTFAVDPEQCGRPGVTTNDGSTMIFDT